MTIKAWASLCFQGPPGPPGPRGPAGPNGADVSVYYLWNDNNMLSAWFTLQRAAVELLHRLTVVACWTKLLQKQQ